MPYLEALLGCKETELFQAKPGVTGVEYERIVLMFRFLNYQKVKPRRLKKKSVDS